MKASWTTKSFEDCLDRVSYPSKIQQKQFLSAGTFPIISQEADFINGYWNDESDVLRVDRPLVVFGDHTQVLKYVDFDFVLGADGVKLLKPKTFIDPKFFYYFLMAHPIKGAGYARHYRFLKELTVHYPPLPEQKRIVAVLEEALAGLATATVNAEKNLNNAHELFHSHLNAVFASPGADWTTSTIGEAIEREVLFAPQDGNHGEIHPKKSDYVADGVPFIMASDLQHGQVNCLECNFISDKTATGLRKGFAKNGDVLLSHKGTIGRVAILATERPFVVLTPQVTYYRINKQGVLSNRFLSFIFESAPFQSEMCHIAGAGSTRAYIGITKQHELVISYPPLAEQLRFASILDEIKQQSHNLESVYQQKLNLIGQLKQSILQRAFSGELTSLLEAINEAAE